MFASATCSCSRPTRSWLDANPPRQIPRAARPDSPAGDLVGGGLIERGETAVCFFGSGLSRVELFEPDEQAAALERYDELRHGPPVLARRVRPNRATEFLTRLDTVALTG